MLKDTKSLGNNKAPACESRGFVRKRKKGCILTHLLFVLFKHIVARGMVIFEYYGNMSNKCFIVAII